MAALLERDLKVPVNVQNLTGGEGVTGHSEGAGAAPDGHTLTLMTVEINMLHWRGLTRLDHRDFTPVALLNRDPAGVFVRSDSPWKTLKDLEGEVRKNPGKLRASGTAAGGIWHLALGGWLAKVGLQPSDINWISFSGSAPSLQEMMGKGLEVVSCSLPEARTFVSRGDVRCLGVMAAERLPAFPDVPTFRELGVDWTMGAWRGIGAPPGLPKRVLEVLLPALERVAKSPEYLGYMKEHGHGAACELETEFEKSLRESDALMGSFLTRAEFRAMVRERVSPMAFPIGLGIAFVAVFAGLAATGGFRTEAGPLTRAGMVRFGETVLWVVLYLLLARTVGFVLTAGGLLVALLFRVGVRPRTAAIVTLIVVPATYYLFAVRLRVSLPQGWLG